MESRIIRIQKNRGQLTVTIPKEFVLKGGYDKEDYVVVDQNQKGEILIRKVGCYGENAGSI